MLFELRSLWSFTYCTRWYLIGYYGIFTLGQSSYPNFSTIVHFFTDRAIFCVKLTQIYEIYTNLLDEEASWSKSQITKHIYTLFSMDDRWKLPKRDVTVYREGLLYKCQTGKIRNWGNGQNVVKLIHILWKWVWNELLIQMSVDFTFCEFLWIWV